MNKNKKIINYRANKHGNMHKKWPNLLSFFFIAIKLATQKTLYILKKCGLLSSKLCLFLFIFMFVKDTCQLYKAFANF